MHTIETYDAHLNVRKLN